MPTTHTSVDGSLLVPRHTPNSRRFRLRLPQKPHRDLPATRSWGRCINVILFLARRLGQRRRPRQPCGAHQRFLDHRERQALDIKVPTQDPADRLVPLVARGIHVPMIPPQPCRRERYKRPPSRRIVSVDAPCSWSRGARHRSPRSNPVCSVPKWAKLDFAPDQPVGRISRAKGGTVMVLPSPPQTWAKKLTCPRAHRRKLLQIEIVFPSSSPRRYGDSRFAICPTAEQKLWVYPQFRRTGTTSIPAPRICPLMTSIRSPAPRDAAQISANPSAIATTHNAIGDDPSGASASIASANARRPARTAACCSGLRP